MKKRTATPLLRAASLVAGSAMTSCSVEARPTGEPTEASPVAPVEMAPHHTVTLAVTTEDDQRPDKPISLTLRAPGVTGGPPLATAEFPFTDRVTVIRWQIDPSVPLPLTYTVGANVQLGDAPSPRDLHAVVTEKVTSVGILRLRPKVPLVDVVLESAMPKMPVYANTKGAHHQQEPAGPAEVLRVMLDAPPDTAGGPLHVMVTRDGQTQPFLRNFVHVGSFPAELVLRLPPDETLFQDVFYTFEIGEETPRHVITTLRSPPHETVRATLAKP